MACRLNLRNPGARLWTNVALTEPRPPCENILKSKNMNVSHLFAAMGNRCLLRAPPHHLSPSFSASSSASLCQYSQEIRHFTVVCHGRDAFHLRAQTRSDYGYGLWSLTIPILVRFHTGFGPVFGGSSGEIHFSVTFGHVWSLQPVADSIW